jgi:hypothetical protein
MTQSIQAEADAALADLNKAMAKGDADAYKVALERLHTLNQAVGVVPRKRKQPRDKLTETELNIIGAGAVERLSRDVAHAAANLSGQQARFLVDAYYMMQDDRKRADSQKRALEENDEPNLVIRWLGEQSETLEKQILRALDEFTDAHVMGNWMRSIHGIGPVISAGMLAHIDIGRVKTAGEIWAYAGWAGKDQKPWEKGQKRPFNAAFRTLCCHPATPITTRRGAVPISEIQVGDEVLTHKGRWRKVSAVHQSDHAGALVALRTTGSGVGPLLVTDNHPVMAEVRRVGAKNRGGRPGYWHADRKLRVGCLPDAQVEHMREMRRSGMKLAEIAAEFECSQGAVSMICNGKTRAKPIENERLWLRADGVLPGYRLLHPIVEPEETVEPVIDLRPHADIIDGDVVYAQGKKAGVRHNAARATSAVIPIDTQIARLLGLFLAEGQVSEHGVYWSFHLAETELHAFVISQIERLGLNATVTPNIENNAVQVGTTNKALARWLVEALGSGAHAKRLPNDALAWPRETLAALVRGAFEGDGTLSGDAVQYTTVSEQLAYGMHAALLALGVASAVSGWRNANGVWAYRLTVNSRGAFFAATGIVPDGEVLPDRFEFRFERGGMWSVVREAETVPYAGPVFNLEVEEDHSYTAASVAVHNCWKLGQSFMKFSNDKACYYGQIYRHRKAYEIANNEMGIYAEQAAINLKRVGEDTEAYKHNQMGKLSPGHIDARARRYAVKLFLSHLFEEWYRRHNGSEPPKPYPIAFLQHVHYVPPPPPAPAVAEQLRELAS